MLSRAEQDRVRVSWGSNGDSSRQIQKIQTSQTIYPCDDLLEMAAYLAPLGIQEQDTPFTTQNLTQ